MTMLNHMLEGPLAYALGWTLLHFCWQGAAIAALLWSVLALLPARSASLRYAVSLAALGLMVALPLATFAHLAEQQLAAHRTLVLPTFEIDAIATPIAAGEPSLPLGDRIEIALERSAPVIPAIWLAGMAVFLARLAAGMAVARKMKSSGVPSIPEDLQTLFTRLRKQLGQTRAVQLLHSANVDAPTVIGWLKPAVLIPVGCLTGMSAVQIEAVLAHELAHIRRHDYLVSVAQSVIEAVLFYHPAVWWVSRQVRQERENCCDDIAAAVAGDRLEYARALSWLEEYRAGMPEIALGANGGVLTMRIRRLLGYREGSVASRTAAAIVLAALFVAGGVVAARAAWRAPVTSVGQFAGMTAVTADQNPGQGAKLRFMFLPVRTPGAPAVFTGSGFNRDDWFDDSRIENRSDRPIVSLRMGWTYVLPTGFEYHQGETVVPQAGILPKQTLGIPAQHAAPRTDAIGYLYYISEVTLADGTVWKVGRDKVESTFAAFRASEVERVAKEAQAELVRQRAEYNAWLNEDVVWIIHPDERAAFLALTNDQERDDFIKNFWLRRDAPGAPANSYKAELYARLIYANMHFSAGTVPGWKTDRGRVYIMYGKPVSMEVHPTGDAGHANGSGSVTSPFPFEVWHYGYVAGIGDNITLAFVDTCRCGLYNYTVDKPGAETGAPARMPPAVPPFSDPAIAQLMGHNIREVNYRGLNSVTITEVAQRLAKNGVSVDPDTTYDPAAVARAAAVLNQMITERGRTSVIRLVVKRVPPDGVGVLFDVKEGPAAGADHAASSGEAARPRFTLASQETTVQPQGPIRVSSGVMAGNLLTRPNPVYPPDAKEQHVQGAVILRATISKMGTIESLEVISGPELLRASALDAVGRWTYKPYLLNGEPTEVDTTITVNYTFDTPAPPLSQVAGFPSPVRVSPGVLAGSLISKVDPIYPEVAKAAHVQGAVVLHALISKTGEIEKLNVISGAEMLRASAMNAVNQWTYKPYLLNGQPTEVETTITVNFSVAPDEGRPDKQLYDNGVAAEAQGQYEVARLRWQTLINMYPNSSLRAGTIRAISDSWQKQGAAAQARGNTLDVKRARAEYEQAVVLQNAEELRARSDNQVIPKQIGGAVSRPTVTSTAEPEYTEEARKAKLSGTVLVNLWVDDEGIPQHVHVVRGLADDPAAKADPKHPAIDRKAAAGLDQKAIEAVKQYRFKPAMEAGKPVTVELNIEVNFQIF